MSPISLAQLKTRENTRFPSNLHQFVPDGDKIFSFLAREPEFSSSYIQDESKHHLFQIVNHSEAKPPASNPENMLEIANFIWEFNAIL